MSRTADLFEDLKPPRAKPKKLMHVSDSYESCSVEDGDTVQVCMTCIHCGYESDWMTCATITEAKKGKPCPQCNQGGE
jgi:hypothetical protein